MPAPIKEPARGGRVQSYIAGDAAHRESAGTAVDNADQAETAVNSVNHEAVTARVGEVELVLQQSVVDVDRRWHAEAGLAAEGGAWAGVLTRGAAVATAAGTERG